MDSLNTSPPIVLNDKKTINAWALFDWANSAFALVITVAIFPAYFTTVTAETVSVLGIEMSNSSLFAYAISGSYLIIALFSPLLSGIADSGGKKKFFLKLFTTIGSIGCLSLFFYDTGSPVALGVIGFMMGMIGFAGGLVFYNSYLPEIVTEDRYDSVSAKGFSYGYIGSVILLCVNLMIIQKPEWFGLGDTGTLTARIAFLMVGLWWIGFALIPFKVLPPDPKRKLQKGILASGINELKKVWKELKKQTNIKAFLLSFFCYSAGVQTILFLASIFAEKELGFDAGRLIIVVLILQIVAIIGAYVFAKVSERLGNITSIFIMLFIWVGICLLAYFVQNQGQFYLVAALVGFVMGGIQSLSRSTYSKLIPSETEDTTSYFSFYDVVEKVAIIVGTFSFGFIEQITGSMRISVLVLAIFFIVSLLILIKVKVKS